MTHIIEPQTPRLKLRQWIAGDFPLFATMNADPEQMQYDPCLLTTEESNALAERFQSLVAEQGWGFWAVEKTDNGKFIGFVGLHKPAYELSITPCVEIGWRIAKEYWGRGYATEAARAALAVGFEQLLLTEIVAFTAVINKKSEAVMRRLNMVNTGKNFEHPLVPDNHPLKEHVLYGIDADSWRNTRRLKAFDDFFCDIKIGN